MDRLLDPWSPEVGTYLRRLPAGVVLDLLYRVEWEGWRCVITSDGFVSFKAPWEP